MSERLYDIPNDPRFNRGRSIYDVGKNKANIDGVPLRGGYLDPEKTILVVVWKSRNTGDTDGERVFLFSARCRNIEDRGRTIFLTRKGAEAPDAFDPPPALATSFTITLYRS